jgi:hypothetical protein
MDLVGRFTGDDAGIAKAVIELWKTQGSSLALQLTVGRTSLDPAMEDCIEYIAAALRVAAAEDTDVGPSGIPTRDTHKEIDDT